MIPRKFTKRINGGGNYCGHNPVEPVLTLVKPALVGKGGIPRILTLCMERLDAYFIRPKLIPSLNFANGSTRKQRSERRESCVLLLKALLKRVDLVSLRVGNPTPDGFLNYTLEYIALDTGMKARRIERAIHDLKIACIVTVSQPREQQPDGSWKGLAAVKTITKDLFGLLGLAEMLKKERCKASKRLKDKIKDWAEKLVTRTSQARNTLSLKSAYKKASKVSQKQNNHTKNKTTAPPDIEYRKRLQLKAAELKEKNMDWDRDKCFEEAEKLLL
ncbi:MAG TPA: hypothetical protein PLL67_06385 [Gammaproteobacteria bacterium]|nr:hypothetical protein [Nitrosomonas sp.]HQZ88361.1 hypothetical protein [Gammaproteobacteria bacterium]